MSAIIFPILAVLIWAANTVVSKLAVGVIDPAAISFYRWSLAGLILMVFSGRALWLERRLWIRYLPKLFVLGVLGMVLYQCLAYVAAETTSATNMGIIVSLLPLLTVGLAVVLLGEAVSMGSLIGGALSLCGLSFLLSHGNPASLFTHGVRLGDGLMLLACLSYAAYGVLLKRWALPLNLWHSLTLQIWCALPVLFAYYLSQSRPPLTHAGLPLVLFAGISASVLAPAMWMLGVRALGASRTSTLMNLLPIFTVAIAVLFLGETLHTYHLTGGAIAMLGVGLAQYWKLPLQDCLATLGWRLAGKKNE